MPHFEKSERLRTSKDFKSVFQRCSKLEDRNFLLYVQFSEDPILRKFGVSLGRALGKANQRNRLKRRLREIYRVEKEHFRGGYQIILIPRRGSADRAYEEIRHSFLELTKKAGLLPRMR
jgi:ribonuclease P protein component